MTSVMDVWNCDELAPMRSLAEIKLFMRLAPEFTAGEKKRGSGGETTYSIDKIKFGAFSDKWNAYVDNRNASPEGAKQLQSLGIRKKSPAHLKQFLISTDDGLKLAWALAGVRDRMIDLRRKLKVSTASDVEPAAQQNKTLYTAETAQARYEFVAQLLDMQNARRS